MEKWLHAVFSRQSGSRSLARLRTMLVVLAALQRRVGSGRLLYTTIARLPARPARRIKGCAESNIRIEYRVAGFVPQAQVAS